MNLYDGNGCQFLPFAKELRQVAGRTNQYDFGGTGGFAGCADRSEAPDFCVGG